MNFLANIIKRIGIAVTDQINSAYDPFEEITRPAVEKYPELLKNKASKFEADLFEHFQLQDGKIWNYKIDLNGPLDVGDQALWHGIYTAMWAFKFSVTLDQDTLATLSRCLDGLAMHQTTGTKTLLVRGVKADGSRQEDASNDSLTGHITGIYFAWLHGTKDIKKKCETLVRSIADELLANNYSLINSNGKPTTHGKLIDGILTDPLRLTLCLVVLKSAYRITNIKNYQDQYVFLLNRYRTFVAYPKVNLLWWDTRYDSHRSAIQLSILADLEEDVSTKALYLKGLERVWNMERKTGNTWITYLYARHFTLQDSQNQICKNMLKEFTLEDKNIVIEKVNSTRTDVRLVKWGNEVLSKQPLPKWQIGSQDFFWQRNLRAVDTWVGVKQQYMIHNGGDFLIAYWLGRRLNLITENE